MMFRGLLYGISVMYPSLHIEQFKEVQINFETNKCYWCERNVHLCFGVGVRFEVVNIYVLFAV